MSKTMDMQEAARRLRALDIPASYHITTVAGTYSSRSGFIQERVKHKLIFDCPNGQTLVFLNEVDNTIDVGKLAAFGLKLASLGGTEEEVVPYNTFTGTDRDKYVGGRHRIYEGPRER